MPVAVATVRAVTHLPLLLAGVLVSTAFGAAAVIAVWHLVEAISGRAAADRAACLLCVFPGTFAFSMVYSEGLLIAAAAASLLSLHRRAWISAGLFAAVASATRPTGVVTIAACGAAALVAATRDRDRRAIVAPVLAAAGVGAYVAYLQLHGGSWSLWFRSQREFWGERMDSGRATYERVRGVLEHGPHLGLRPLALNDLMATLGIAFILVSLVLLWRWRPPLPVVVYALGTLALVLESAHVGPRPRMLLGAFPLVAAVGVMAKGRIYVLVAASATVSLAVLSLIIFTTRATTP